MGLLNTFFSTIKETRLCQIKIDQDNFFERAIWQYVDRDILPHDLFKVMGFTIFTRIFIEIDSQLSEDI